MVADGMDGVNFTSVLLPILLASGRCPALQLQPYMTHSMPLKENTNTTKEIQLPPLPER